MLYKTAHLKIESSSTIDRDILLFGPKKTAFIKHDISDALVHASNSLDIVAEIKERNPDEWVIARARAIDAGGSEKTGEIFHGENDNADFFSEEELLAVNDSGLKAFETFVGCPIFCNHENQKIEKARGKIVSAFYDLGNHCVYVDFMVDGKAYPELARGIRQGYINDVSMGTSCKYSLCSICQHKAHNEEEYCLVAGTKITLDDHTIANIEDIRNGDYVLTHDGSSQKVLELMRREIEEPIYEIYVTDSNIPLEITGNHPVLTVDKMDYRATFDIYFNQKNRYTQEERFNPKWKNAENIEIGDYVLSPKYKISNSMDVSNDFARLCGIYVAEGCIFRQKYKEGKKIDGLYFTIGLEEEELKDDIARLCKTITGKDATFHKNDHAIQIKICDRELANKIYNIFGEYSKDKYFGEDFYKWNLENIKAFLGGYIDGDGYYNSEKQSVGIRTASKSIAIQLPKILSFFDSWGSVVESINSENNVVKYVDLENDKLTYLITMSQNDFEKLNIKNCIKTKSFENKSSSDTTSHWIKDNYDVVRVRKISKKEFSGTVFNFEVENNNSYIANNIIVHNCDHLKKHKGKTINGKKVYEINKGLKFIELSAVTDGACENCTIQNVYTGPEFLNKLTELVKSGSTNINQLRKVAAITKQARGEDVDKLNNALDLLKEVADQILNSKDVDYEFLEDIGSLLSELQNLIVDLVEAGFANQQAGGGNQPQPGEETEIPGEATPEVHLWRKQ